MAKKVRDGDSPAKLQHPKFCTVAEMLSARGIQRACPRCNFSSSLSAVRFYNPSTSLIRSRALLQGQLVQSNKTTAITQNFSTSRCLRQEATAAVAPRASPEETEQIVRDAKQRFRDTLPKGYLTAEEYALYERLYGPPLRETAPEDVGIDTHADMGPQPARPSNEGTVLRELENGEMEYISYRIPRAEPEEVEEAEQVEENFEENIEAEQDEEAVGTAAPQELGYVDLVARSQREYDAMQKLAEDFRETQRKQQEKEEEDEEHLTEEAATQSWPDEEEHSDFDRDDGDLRRFHPYSIEGRFHGSPVEIVLPKDEMITPLRGLLDRAHIDHVKKAAEDAFGGRGLPLSPSTPQVRKNGNMKGVGLPADKKHMTEIDADAFIAGFIPPMYASALSVLREVRKRSGSDWIQSKLKSGAGLSILDAGSGGAGLIAWDQILRAEWDLLKENGEVKGLEPPGKRTVVVGSDRLRYRMKHLLHNTTFLPRLPDYEHSGEMRGGHLDAPSKPQPRKSYDVIIASHLFLQEEQDHYRQAILNNLWSLLNKDGGVLIVMEKAHPRGFEAVAHVRDTLLKQFLLPQSGEPDLAPVENFDPNFHKEREVGHIIAPCTNHSTCPMYRTQGKSPGRKDYCHFSQRFVRPLFYTKLLGMGSNNQGEVEFSYLAIKRGVPKDSKLTGKEATVEAFQGYEKSESKPNMAHLPRMVLPPLKRKGHITLDLCTAEGQIERWTIPKSFSKLAYHDARKSKWGDLWALGAKTRVIRNVRAGKGQDDGGKRAEREPGKKPRRVQVAMGPDGMTAKEKNAGKARRPKSKKDRQQDLLREFMFAEKREEQEIGDEIQAEVEAMVEEEERREQSRARR